MIREPRSALLAIALALVGALFPLAFAPFSWWPVAPACLAVLFVAADNRSVRASLWLAFSFGLGMFASGVGWISESFQYSNVHGPIVWILTLGFVAFLAVFPAGALALAQRCNRVPRAAWFLLVLPAAWMLVEWLRGWLLTGFTWLQLGYTQSDAAGSGLVPVIGSYGAGLLVAVSAGAVAALVRARSRGTVLGVSVVVAVWLLGFGLQGVVWTQPVGEPLRIASIQGNYAQDIKWKRENFVPTLRRYRTLTQKALVDGARLIVWPETAIPAFAHRVETFSSALRSDLRPFDATLLFGIPVRDEMAKVRNSVVALGNDEAVYHKRHLVPFGEYVPFAALLTPVLKALRVPVPNFVPAEEVQSVLRHANIRLGITICYEAAFGSEVAAVLPESNVLVNVSNDAWFGDSIAPHQHLQIAQLRALEAGRPMLRSTNTGVSALIAPDGSIMATSPQFKVHVLTGSVQPMRGATPYVIVGDWPFVASVLVVLLLAAWRSRRER